MRAVNSAIGSVLMVLLFGGFIFDARAQDTEWMQVDVVNVVPDRLEDYVKLQMEEVSPALQRAGVPWRSVWRVAEFGNSYELHLVTPINDLGQYDSGGPLARVLEPESRQRLVDRLRRMTVSRKRYAMRYRPDVSVEAEEIGGLSLARVVTLEVVPGRATDWEEFMQTNLTNFSDADLVFGVYERVLGPGPAAWLIVENYASFAELELPSLVARAGVTTSPVFGMISSIERIVLRYDPELSYSGISLNMRR